MSSYERFLGRADRLVLPYLGGASVDAPTRRLRVVSDAIDLAPGWWLFSVEGRNARPIEPAAAPDMSALPSVRGHWVAGVVIAERSTPSTVELCAEEPLRFAPVAARRWRSGDVLFEAFDFETGVEESARRAFEDGGDLRGLRGVPATLRAAFAVAVGLQEAANAQIVVRPQELRADIARIADGGRSAAAVVIDRIRRERRAATRVTAGAGDPAASPPQWAWQQYTGHRRPTPADRAGERAADALDKSGAVLHDFRLISPELLEVRFRFMGERFVAVVDPHSLQVRDAGVCLAGRDALVTLESLPPVIREAIQRGRLVITREFE